MGFTLVELMVTMTIIGILATVAVPQYKKYVDNVKTVEAYQIIDNMSKSQISYYSENKKYITLQWNPAMTLDGTSNAKTWTAPEDISYGFFWQALGYPASPGQRSIFQYMSDSGRNDERNDGATNDPTGSGYGLDQPLQSLNAADGIMKAFCTNDQWIDPRLEDPTFVNPATIAETFTPLNFGVYDQSPSDFDWVVIAAMGNLRSGTPVCKYVGVAIQGISGGEPARRGIVQFDYNFSNM